MIKTRELCKILIDYFSDTDYERREDVIEWCDYTLAKMDEHNQKAAKRERKKKEPSPNMEIVRSALTPEWQSFEDLVNRSGLSSSVVRGYLSNYKSEYETTAKLGETDGKYAVIKYYKKKA